MQLAFPSPCPPSPHPIQPEYRGSTHQLHAEHRAHVPETQRRAQVAVVREVRVVVRDDLENGHENVEKLVLLRTWRKVIA